MTQELPDYYAVLGVPSTASPAEIAHAYRRRIRSQHPDVQDGAGSEGLSAVVAAYAVLRDPARRADYDQRRRPAPPPVTPPSRTRPLLRVGPVRYHGPPH
ncbi:MAG TPA: DnaJ domain-containing protein [Pseudonocardiaceae bacterium]|nr:DnaJ domain-containing protein [Pseudonocardiaceae bacterium]